MKGSVNNNSAEMVSAGSQKNLLDQNRPQQSAGCRFLNPNLANPALAANLECQQVIPHDTVLGHLYEAE